MAISALATKIGIPIIGGLITKILDKVAKDKVDDATMLEIHNAAQEMLRDQGQEDLQQFYDFMLEYEGKAEDHGPFIKWLRGSVRPIITYLNFGMLVFVMFTWVFGWHAEGVNLELAIKVCLALNGLTLAFWFGERALQNIGLQDFFKIKAKQ